MVLQVKDPRVTLQSRSNLGDKILLVLTLINSIYFFQ